MPDEVATVAEEVKTIPAQVPDKDALLPGQEPGTPLPGEPGSIYTHVGDIGHGLPLKQVAETKLIVDQQAANDAVTNNAPNEDAIAEAEEREQKRQGLTSGDRFASRADSPATKAALGAKVPPREKVVEAKVEGKAADVHKTETEPGVKGVQVPSR